MKTLHILIDSRERKPLLFPDTITLLDRGGKPFTAYIQTKVEQLETADYLLATHPRKGGIERKADLKEVATNCLTKDVERFRRCLDRLEASCEFPALLFENTLNHLLGKVDKVGKQSLRGQEGIGLDGLLAEVLSRRIPLISVTCGSPHQRRKAGEVVARYLYRASLAGE